MAAAKGNERVFEVIHGSVTIDKDGKSRGVGAEIRESEMPDTPCKSRAQLIEQWMNEGIIRDTAMPLAPLAVANTVTAHFLNLAQDLGIVTNSGAVYQLGDRKFQGRDALIDGVTTSELADAIKAHVAGKDAAITELTKQLPAK